MQHLVFPSVSVAVAAARTASLLGCDRLVWSFLIFQQKGSCWVVMRESGVSGHKFGDFQFVLFGNDCLKDAN